MDAAIQSHIQMHHTITRNVGGADITIETGKLANLADGSVTVRLGDCLERGAGLVPAHR